MPLKYPLINLATKETSREFESKSIFIFQTEIKKKKRIEREKKKKKKEEVR